MGRPSVYPTGVTIYDKEKAYNGYTLITTGLGATLIDMNGRIRKVWRGLANPVIPLELGTVMGGNEKVPGGKAGASGQRRALVVNWEGNVIWRFENNQEVVLPDGSKGMAARVHHDMDRLPNGNMLLLTHENANCIKISDKMILDERIIEVDHEGKIVWEWRAREHFDEYGLDETAKKAIFNNPSIGGDWIHLNAVRTLGPNHFYDEGDERFDPENIICSSRQLNIIFIIDKKTGDLVWRLGPDYKASKELKEIGQIIGQHGVHMIPQGFPGEGNILLFDNGSFGGYGAPTGVSPDGCDAERRHYSRVLEINPSTLELVWEYMEAVKTPELINSMNAANFFSAYISNAQRLPNGNTLINEGADGQIIEVTPEKKIIWEFINPVENPNVPPKMKSNIYRAYRVPYEWAPQLEVMEEISVIPPENSEFRVPGSVEPGDGSGVTTVINL